MADEKKSHLSFQYRRNCRIWQAGSSGESFEEWQSRDPNRHGGQSSEAGAHRQVPHKRR